jgi:hypothetical protein
VSGDIANQARATNHWTLVNGLLPEIQATGEGLRVNYTWSILHAASVAIRTGRERIAVVELGVAGGAGLLAMEAAALAIERRLGVAIEVYGFDTGRGLPRAVDLRDAPFLIDEGDFPMDQERLRARLLRAELILGDVAETIPVFLASRPPPIGFVSYDLDYYSSTTAALALLRAEPACLFPRVLCYFDDVHGYPWGDCNGALLAIREFSGPGDPRQLVRLPGLRFLVPGSERDARWPEAMYVAHAFDHPAYAEPEGTALVQRLDLD